MRKSQFETLRWCSALLLALAACGGSVQTDSLTSRDVLQPGPDGVGFTEIVFEDASRPTMPNRSFPGSPTRRLVTEIWYPTAPDPHADPFGQRNAPVLRHDPPGPLIVHSHGFNLLRLDLGYVARHLASHGYVFVAADHPLSNLSAPGGATLTDVANQPGDLTFLIDQMLALNTDPHSAFTGAIDAQRIGLTGYSLGGATVYLTAFDRRFRDPRVRAVVPMASAGCNFTHEFFSTARIPLLILQGDIDSQVAYQEQSVFAFANANPPKYLATIRAGSHAGFFEGLELYLKSDNPDHLNCRPVRGPTPVPFTLFDLIGGTDAGLIHGDCPRECRFLPLPPAIAVARQHQLAILSIFSFFEATLRGNEPARRFLQETLAAENPEITVQSAP